MADSSIAVTPGSGALMDTRTEATNGEHRQVVVLGDPATNANVASVSSGGALYVQGLQSSRTAYSVTATGNSGSLACSNFNICTVTVSGTYAGVTLFFEGSDDGGTTWFGVQGTRGDVFITENNSGSLTNVTRSWDLPIGAFTHFRVRASTWTSGTAAVGIGFQAMPYEPSPTVGISGSYMGRTQLTFSAVAAAAGTTGTETAISLTKSPGPGSATSSASSFVVTSGKRFRITSFAVASRGNATATIQATTFNLRVNTGGAVTTSSNVWLSLRSATPATASAWDRYAIAIHEGIEVLGDGTLQFGITAAATYTTNAPTWDVTITGFEY